jgi:transcriptional regulator with XRE-family HTH domain
VKRRATSLIDVFAANLRRYRSEASLTQERLGELAGLHRTYVGSAERGERNVSLRAIEQLARALDVPPRDLLDERTGQAIR